MTQLLVKELMFMLIKLYII